MTCVKGDCDPDVIPLCRAVYRALASAFASRVCWLKIRIRGTLDREVAVDVAILICSANHFPVTSMLSIVCPPSMCHATLVSRLISHLPAHRTCSRPRMNSEGSSIWGTTVGSGTEVWPSARRCAAAAAIATDALIFWNAAPSPSLISLLARAGCMSMVCRTVMASSF